MIKRLVRCRRRVSAGKRSGVRSAAQNALNESGILDNYIVPCYDVLHTQGRQYLVDDITEFAKEKGMTV